MRQFLDGRVILHAGDCIEVMNAMPENSVDAIVCDPPYHLTSIVKRFGGEMPPRTEATVGKHAYGRHAAGFMGKEWDGGDIAFQVDTWKAALRVLKPGGYILAFASTRGFWRMCVAIEDAGFITHPMIAWVFGSGFPKATRLKTEGYDGWRYGGQALKPAIEPIYMGQKPFSEKTGTANVLKHGTGAINIDGCRVEGAFESGWSKSGSKESENGSMSGKNYAREPKQDSQTGRWPANLIHDGSEDVLSAFPVTESGSRSEGDYGLMGYHGAEAKPMPAIEGDSGSAARFFYSSKADSDDRVGSKHPTVKPIDLMRYLVRLITPPGGTVLDPFAGTGTTGEAAWREGFNSVLIEREPEYQNDIAERMRLCLAGPDEKRREIIKRRGVADDSPGPLFAGGPA